MTDQQDTVMASAAAEVDATRSPPPTTARELELLRLLELKQQEVDDLSSTLTLLTQNPAARPPPLPLPAPSEPAALESSDQKLVIPRALLPVLAHLRAHCTALAAQNDELLAVLAEVSIDGTSAAIDSRPLATASDGQPKRRQVDLAKVVDRLRVLSDENRELEAVVESLGRQVGEARGLKAALEEAHDAILTLDSDLEHSYGQIEALQAILADCEAHFGPLPASFGAQGAPSGAMSS